MSSSPSKYRGSSCRGETSTERTLEPKWHKFLRYRPFHQIAASLLAHVSILDGRIFPLKKQTSPKPMRPMPKLVQPKLQQGGQIPSLLMTNRQRMHRVPRQPRAVHCRQHGRKSRCCRPTDLMTRLVRPTVEVSSNRPPGNGEPGGPAGPTILAAGRPATGRPSQ